MATRATLKTELDFRLGDGTDTIWTAPEKQQYVDDAIASLYPYYYLRQTNTSVAGAGPMQTMPSGAINLYYIGLQSTGSNRARVIRGWQEGTGQAVVPKLNITGQTLIWAWTIPHTVPASSGTVLTLPIPAEEVVILRAQITALERVLSNRVKAAKYFAIQVREGVTENEIISSLDALHASLDARLKNVLPLPERVG